MKRPFLRLRGRFLPLIDSALSLLGLVRASRMVALSRPVKAAVVFEDWEAPELRARGVRIFQLRVALEPAELLYSRVPEVLLAAKLERLSEEMCAGIRAHHDRILQGRGPDLLDPLPSDRRGAPSWRGR